MPPRDISEMIRRVDAFLYAAKTDGKNQLRHVVFEGDKIAATELADRRGTPRQRDTDATFPKKADAE
jgi:hypothetical protein